jgi:hypothetical protein
VSAGRTSPIHYPDGRDRFLDAISQPGATLDSAAESIGTSVKTVRRFSLDHPEWAEQIERARNGLEWRRESGRVLAMTPSSAVVDAVICEVPERERPADAYNGITRREYESTLAEVFRDRSDPNWPHVFKVYATLFDGPEIIRARRRAENEPLPPNPGGPLERVLVIRVPARPAAGG